MEVQTMLRTAIALLAITAIGGLLMAGLRFSGRPRPPTAVAMLHGLLAASGLTLILYAAFTAGLPGGGWAGLVLLVVAALGGLVLNLRYQAYLNLIFHRTRLAKVGHAVCMPLVVASMPHTNTPYCPTETSLHWNDPATSDGVCV